MNNNDNLSSDQNDSNFEDALAGMKRVEPTLEARIRYRQVIATELARIGERRISVSRHWWKQSFPVPVPVALSVCVLVLASFVTWVSMPSSTPDLTAGSPPATEKSALANPIAKSPTMDDSDARPRLVYSASETYLCGIGRLKYESNYQFQE